MSPEIMLPIRRVATLLSALILGGCQVPKPVADDALARQVIADLQAGRSAAVVARLDSTVANLVADTPALLSAITDSLAPFFPMDSAALVGWNIVDRPDDHSATLTYELRGPGRWALASVTLHGRGAAARVLGMHYEGKPASLATTNAFAIRGKPVKHYMFLGLALATAVSTLGSAIVVASTRGMRRRWLWVVIALLGVGVFRLNWSTGETGVQPFEFELFGAGFMRVGQYAPWLVSFALPLGAVVALTRRRRTLQAAKGASSPQLGESETPAA